MFLLNRIKSSFFFVFHLFLLFGILFDINFHFMPGLTSGRIAFFGCLIFFLSKVSVKNIKFRNVDLFFSLCLFFLFVISLLQFLNSNDFTQSSRLIYFSVYGFFCPHLIVRFIDSKFYFLILIGISCFIQSILTISSYLIPDFKLFLEEIIIYNTNYNSSLTIRALGFSSNGGAALSVVQSLGILSYLIILRNFKFKFWFQFLFWLQIFFILISIFFIGRTGLIVSLFCIVGYIVSSKKIFKSLLLLLFFIFLISQINFTVLIENATTNIEGYKTDLFLDWIASSFVLNNNELVVGLKEMPIAPLSLETMIGTGYIKDFTGLGNASGHDSGYIQTYFSLGLIFAFLFYFSYFIYLISHFFNTNNVLSLLLIFMLFLIEVKEFFIFSYTLPFFLLTFLLLDSKKIKII